MLILLKADMESKKISVAILVANAPQLTLAYTHVYRPIKLSLVAYLSGHSDCMDF